MSVIIEEAINELIRANNKLNSKVNSLQNDVRGLKEYFTSIGNFTEAMQSILTDALEKTRITNELSIAKLKETGEFYKFSESQKYPNQNLLQEWFSDLVIEVLVKYTDYDKEHLKTWINLKFSEYKRKVNQQPGFVDYESRANFGEEMFQKMVSELGLTKKGLFILRTLYIPYLSLYYLRPMRDYPMYDEWVKALT